MSDETAKEISSKYAPSEVEGKWYEYWMENGFFRSEPDEREPYTVVIPPPNVTGILHMGHMLNNTIQDILVRRARMEGKNACWVPGTDHASIATEAKVVEKLAKEGVKKTDLTREEFLEHAWEWTHKHGGIILEQLKKLGASCDWDRTCFTMDEKRSESVIKVFADLYNKGLIYRGVRMVNWDPAAKTALSDEEVNYKEQQGKLYYIKYKIVDNDTNTPAGKTETAKTAGQKKTFAIGDGMKSVCVSDRYSAELENSSALLLYNPENNNIWIRIEVLSFESEDGSKTMFDKVIEQGKEKNLTVEIVGDKSYYLTSNRYEEEGDQIITYFYNIGCQTNDFILISVTTFSENSETEQFKAQLAEIPEMIASIQKIAPDEKTYRFNLTNDNCNVINKISAEILGITEAELDDFHETGQTLKTIQKFLDAKKFGAGQIAELESLGYAFGDYIQYKYPEFEWRILHDQYGRDFCLIYGKTLNIFPVTMILKRVEKGEKFNIEQLLTGILKTVKEETAECPAVETPTAENDILAEFQEQLSGFSEEKRQKINAVLRQLAEDALKNI